MIKTRKHFSFKNIKSEGDINPPNFPHLLKNFYFANDGTLKAFPSLKKLISIQRPHSLFKIRPNEYLVCSIQNGNDHLYLFISEPPALIPIKQLSVSYGRMWYVLNNGKVYFSNRNSKGIYDIASRTVLDWKPTTTLTFEESEEASDYFFTDVIEFPACENLCLFYGRIFGNIDNRVWFTEPIFCHYTKPSNFIDMPDKVIGIASTNTQILICLPNSFYVGSLQDSKGGFNLIFDTYSGLEILPYSALSYKDMFLFLTKEGICLFKDNTYNLINKGLCDLILRGNTYINKISDGAFAIGGDQLSIDFKESIDVEIIKKEVN